MERGPNWSMGGGKLLCVQLNVEKLCVDRGIESSYKGMKKRSQEKLPRDQANSLLRWFASFLYNFCTLFIKQPQGPVFPYKYTVKQTIVIAPGKTSVFRVNTVVLEFAIRAGVSQAVWLQYPIQTFQGQDAFRHGITEMLTEKQESGLSLRPGP